jgi:hypothetical protein
LGICFEEGLCLEVVKPCTCTIVWHQ